MCPFASQIFRMKFPMDQHKVSGPHTAPINCAWSERGTSSMHLHLGTPLISIYEVTVIHTGRLVITKRHC